MSFVPLKFIPYFCTCVMRCLWLTAILATHSAAAHDFWIEPEVLSATAGDAVSIRLREGVGFTGNTLPYIPQWFADFTRVTPAGRERVVSLTGDDPAAVLQMPDGAALLGYQSLRNLTTLDAAKFNSYLEDEGITFIRELRIERGEDDAPAPEYFVRCAKALLQAPGSDPGDIYATELGYTLELIPAENPYELAAGDELAFRLLLRGQPATGLLLQAYTRTSPERIQKVRIDETGHARIRLTEPGVWLVKAVSIEEELKSEDADWLSYWASFVFELPASQPR